MKSFDDALNEHKRLLTESLINFNEWQRVRKIMLDIDINSADYEYYFQAGQQSKQAEVDELRFQRDVLSNKVDELQKQIDEALKLLNLAYPESWAYCVDEAINILKGENHE